MLTAAYTIDGLTTIRGTFRDLLTLAAPYDYTIQFFSRPAADPSDPGQGRVLVGQVKVSPFSQGSADFVVTFPAAVGVVSATATFTQTYDSIDRYGVTSEFSPDLPIVALASPIYAGGDAYSVGIDPTATAAPGVLSNDFALDGGMLTAELLSGPSHGSLALDPDGSFTYAPAAGYIGPDSFTYSAMEGAQISDVATVSINVFPKTFYVTNTDERGPGSLGQAILDADVANDPAPDTILFDIPGTGPFVITSDKLPAVTHATTIDGYSQPGSSANTLPQGDNAVLMIQIDGGGGGVGLDIASGGCTVTGLCITDCNTGISIEGQGNDAILGDFVGIDPSGETTSSNFIDGISLADAPSVTIGGTSPSARVLVTTAYYYGFFYDQAAIYASNSPGLSVLGSFVGTDRTGTNYLGFSLADVPYLNTRNGIYLANSPNATIGGSAAGAGNVIADSDLDGESIEVSDTTSSGALIQGNMIGVDVTGTKALGAGAGVSINGGTVLDNVISGNAINGLTLGDDNMVQGNDIGTDATGTKALGNGSLAAFYDPIGGGIDVLGGDNTIGGAASQGNLISANADGGILVGGLGHNLIQGNDVGTDVTGTKALGNGTSGTSNNAGIYDGSLGFNTIGGAGASEGNLISGNQAVGLSVGSNDLILGNDIGTDATGTKALGNGGAGIQATQSNTIGGAGASRRQSDLGQPRCGDGSRGE